MQCGRHGPALHTGGAGVTEHEKQRWEHLIVRLSVAHRARAASGSRERVYNWHHTSQHSRQPSTPVAQPLRPTTYHPHHHLQWTPFSPSPRPSPPPSPSRRSPRTGTALATRASRPRALSHDRAPTKNRAHDSGMPQPACLGEPAAHPAQARFRAADDYPRFIRLLRRAAVPLDFVRDTDYCCITTRATPIPHMYPFYSTLEGAEYGPDLWGGDRGLCKSRRAVGLESRRERLIG